MGTLPPRLGIWALVECSRDPPIFLFDPSDLGFSGITERVLVEKGLNRVLTRKMVG